MHYTRTDRHILHRDRWILHSRYTYLISHQHLLWLLSSHHSSYNQLYRGFCSLQYLHDIISCHARSILIVDLQQVVVDLEPSVPGSWSAICYLTNVNSPAFLARYDSKSKPFPFLLQSNGFYLSPTLMLNNKYS